MNIETPSDLSSLILHLSYNEGEMVTYIVLWKFTDDGARNIKHTTGRSEVFKAQAKSLESG